MEMTSNIKEFIRGGNSTFTIKNDKTNVRYTYKVKKHKKNPIYFVSFLRGADNESDYAYMGIIDDYKGGAYRLTNKSKVNTNSIVHKAFDWLWTKVNKKAEFPQGFHFFHEGKCGRCGRKLTTPKSIERGFGPTCINLKKD